MNNDPGTLGIGAIVIALIGGAFGWLVQGRKSETDQEVAVMGEWSKLNKGLADRLAAVEKAFAEYRAQVAQDFEKLRKEHADEIEDMRKRHRAEMRAMRDLNEGLQRMIAQNSQSTAQLLSDSPVTQPKDEGDVL